MKYEQLQKNPATLYKKGYWLLLAVLIAVTLGTLLGISRTYQHHANSQYEQVEERLQLVSQIQTQNVQRWREAHVADAAALSDDRLYSNALASWISQDMPLGRSKQLLLERLQTLVQHRKYALTHIIDTKGNWLLGTTAPPARRLPEPERHALEQALQTALPVIVEPRKSDLFAFPFMGVMAPLYQGYEPIGAAWLIIDLRSGLFPLLQSWQLNSPDAETILTQRTTSGIVNINPMRQGQIKAFANVLPMTRTISPGVQAVSGVRGVVRAVNYQDKPVLAMLSHVEGSPWWLVLQISEDQALGNPERREGLALGLQISAVLLLAGVAISAWQWVGWHTERGIKRNLQEYTHWLDTAQRSAGLGFFVYDFDAQQLELSPEAASIFGVSAGALSLKAWSDLIVPEDKKRILKTHSAAILRGEQIHTQYRILRSGKELRWVQFWADLEQPLQTQGASKTKRVLGIVQDISERKRTEEELDSYRRRLEHQVRQDPLTLLANRLALDEVANKEWRRAQRYGHNLSILMIDIDHFKTYNDTYGHLEGDECLRRVASVIAASAQRAGELAARYGGEEFSIVLPHYSQAQAQAHAQRLNEAVRALRIEHANTTLPSKCVTISIGIATLKHYYSDEGQNGHSEPSHSHIDHESGLSELFAQADEALYAAKQAGRDRWCSYQQS